MEHEQEQQISKLTKKIERLEKETNNKQTTLEQVRERERWREKERERDQEGEGEGEGKGGGGEREPLPVESAISIPCICAMLAHYTMYDAISITLFILNPFGSASIENVQKWHLMLGTCVAVLA